MFNKKKIASAIALSAIGASALTVAPMVTAEEAITLEEIVVTARKRAENLQEVPVAVSALTGEDLAVRGTGNIAELADEVPSVTLEASRATNSTLTAFIRGVGQQDPLAGFEQGVGIYLDDVYLARPQGAMLDVYEVERVEVLRGPQGTLYGRNTVGGAIKYITKRLSEDPTARVKVGVGTYNQQDVVLTGSLPVSDELRIGATVANLTRDGFGENLTTGEENYNKDLLAARFSAEWMPSDEVFVRFSVDKSEDDSAPVGGHRLYEGAVDGEPVLTDIYDTRSGASRNYSTEYINGKNRIEAEGVHLTVEWSPTDEVTIKSVTAHRNDYTTSVIDFDSLANDDFDAGVIYDNEQNSQEVQLTYTGDTVKAVTGFYLLDAKARNDFDIALGAIGRLLYGLGAQAYDLPVLSYTGGDVETDSWSFYTDWTVDFSDQWSLAFGARYTSDKRVANVLRASYFGESSPFMGGTLGVDIFDRATTGDMFVQKTFTNFSPRINVSYQMNDDVNFYLGYSQGWKAGGFDPRAANLVLPEAEEGFDDEILKAWELGMKSTWWDGRARTNVALFHSTYEDMQVPSSLGLDTDGDGINDDFVGAVTNAGEAVIQGIEIEAELLLMEGLTLSVAGSALDANIEEWIVADVDVSSQRVVQNTPEEMANITLRHKADVFAGQLTSSLSWSHKGDSSQFEVPVDVIDQEAYQTVNLSVVWMDDEGNWTIGVHGKNLTDEEIKTSAYCFGATAGCATAIGLEDNTTAFYAPPMTVSASVEYSF